MYTEPRVIVDAVKEPVSLTYVKLHTKVDHSAEDSLFNVWIPAARRYFENATGTTVHEKTLEVAFSEWPSYPYHFVLPRATPLIEVVSVKYLGTDGTENTWATGNYISDTYSGRVGRAYQISWPATTLYGMAPIRIRYRAGIATTSPETEAPEDIQQCVAMLIEHFFRNRGAVMFSDRGIILQSQAVEMAARSIIQQHIAWRFH
jgi:uncharacterized phiE125 gp8 family phage protein